MNGRVYDPILARFLSPDPIVIAPYFSQSYNRYSYVWNNPMSLSDPSGYVPVEPPETVTLMVVEAMGAQSGKPYDIFMTNSRAREVGAVDRQGNARQGQKLRIRRAGGQIGASSQISAANATPGRVTAQKEGEAIPSGRASAQKENLNPFKIIREEFPKWFKSEVIPKFAIYAGGDATVVPGAGPAGGIGSYFTTDNGISTWETGYPGGDFEFGSYTSVGGALGLDADASLGFGLSFGNLTNFQGAGSSLGFDFGPVSLDLNFNDSEQWTGFRFSVNTPLPGISDGVSTTTTRAY